MLSVTEGSRLSLLHSYKRKLRNMTKREKTCDDGKSESKSMEELMPSDVGLTCTNVPSKPNRLTLRTVVTVNRRYFWVNSSVVWNVTVTFYKIIINKQPQLVCKFAMTLRKQLLPFSNRHPLSERCHHRER